MQWAEVVNESLSGSSANMPPAKNIMPRIKFILGGTMAGYFCTKPVSNG